MNIVSEDKLKKELEQMFKHKWSCLNTWLVPGIIADVITFIQNYKNERENNEG